jgi:hypothetical protein
MATLTGSRPVVVSDLERSVAGLTKRMYDMTTKVVAPATA